jgi:hypothetical protein
MVQKSITYEQLHSDAESVTNGADFSTIIPNFDLVQIKSTKSNVKQLSARKKTLKEELRRITEEEDIKRL